MYVQEVDRQPLLSKYSKGYSRYPCFVREAALSCPYQKPSLSTKLSLGVSLQKTTACRLNQLTCDAKIILTTGILAMPACKHGPGQGKQRSGGDAEPSKKQATASTLDVELSPFPIHSMGWTPSQNAVMSRNKSYMHDSAPTPH